MNLNLKSEPQVQRAIIYCRVSSVKQVEEGHGLQSQETRCRQYALEKGYNVEAVFPDGVSGGGDFMKRPGMVALLAYLEAQAGQKYIVIFDDLKRFARDTEFHIKLRRELAARSASVECLNFKFEDSPEGRFIETILAAQGELERAQNGRQVSQKMKARMMNGYWCFHAPSGYRYAKTKEHGKLLVRDEPLASVVQEVFERLANGSLQTVTEAVAFLGAQAGWTSLRSSAVNYQTIYDLLRRPLYAGYIEMPTWDIALQRGKHEPLISFETWQKAQERLKGTTYAAARNDISDDFPLRGFVNCGKCDCALTSGWSKSQGGTRHAYYRCKNNKCASYGKSIRKAQLEGDFESYLHSLEPQAGLLGLFKRMFNDAWSMRLGQADTIAAKYTEKAQLLQVKIDSLLDRLVDAETATVVKAYESKINNLEREKLIALEKAQTLSPSTDTFDELFEHALTFLKNPAKLWASGIFELQRLVMRMAFSDRVGYCRETRSLNTKLSLPFSMLTHDYGGEKRMVGLAGFEPATNPL